MLRGTLKPEGLGVRRKHVRTSTEKMVVAAVYRRRNTIALHPSVRSTLPLRADQGRARTSQTFSRPRRINVDGKERRSVKYEHGYLRAYKERQRG